jgi:hypothetical protein
MCAEASSILRAVAEDFFFNYWYLEIPSDSRIQRTKVSPPACARLLIGSVLGFLCRKCKPYPRVVFLKSGLV